MDIDVRKGAEVERIIFGQDNEHLFLSGDYSDKIAIYDFEKDFAYVSIIDIPNLIKALQKAQEVWGDK